jgi:hypothetical protein
LHSSFLRRQESIRSQDGPLILGPHKPLDALLTAGNQPMAPKRRPMA